MPTFAQLDNNTVTGVLVAAEMPTLLPSGRSFVETKGSPVILGATYDPVGGTFTPPPPPPPPRKQIAKVDFLRLVQPAEFAAMQKAATGGDAMTTYGLAVLGAARFIDPADPLLKQLMDYAVTIAVLTQARHDAILAGLAAL